jgi:hypothetical protein
MTQSIEDLWRAAFLRTVQQYENAALLREAALQGRLGAWTKELTSVVVATCKNIGWRAAAKGHMLELLPVARSEYLSLDIMAFSEREKKWLFPIAAIELENSRDDDRIAYSLWKVLCVRADLRAVFCYRQNTAQVSSLIERLRNEVVQAMGLAGRLNLEGRTLIVVGSRDNADTFPYGFFKWWILDNNTGSFRKLS